MLNVSMVAWLHKLAFCSVSLAYFLRSRIVWSPCCCAHFFQFFRLRPVFFEGGSLEPWCQGFCEILTKTWAFVCFWSYFNWLASI